MDFGLEQDSLLLREALLASKGNSVGHRIYAGTDHAFIIGLAHAWGQPFPPMITDVCSWLKAQVSRLLQEKNNVQGDESEVGGRESEESLECSPGGQSSEPFVLRDIGWE